MYQQSTIVQVNPETHPELGGMLVVVSKCNNSYLTGYYLIPQDKGLVKAEVQLYLNQVYPVGQVEWETE